MRLDMEKVVPVTVLDLDAMTARNAQLPVDMLTSLPSVVNLPENETRLGSSGARGENANFTGGPVRLPLCCRYHALTRVA